MTWIFGQQIWNGFITGMAYVLFSMSLTLIFGILGVINMAHGELYMLGAMLLWTVINYLHLNFFLAMVLSIVAMGLFGILFNQVAVKPLIGVNPLSTMLSTMAVSVILIYGSIVIWNVESRSIQTPFKGNLVVYGAVLPWASIVLCLIGLGVLVALYFFLTKNKFGKAIRATSQDRMGASLIGINIKGIYAFTMAVSSALAATAGAILAPIWVANPGMGQDILMKGFAVGIVGGMGNLKACVFTGLFLGITEAVFSQYVSMYYRDIYVFGIMILAVLVRPQGLFPRL